MFNLSTSRRSLLATLAIVWLFVVVLSYYILHKPFDLANAIALAITLGSVLVIGLLLVLAAAMGHRILRVYAFGSTLEALVIQCGVGLGAIAFAVFALGWLGLVQRIVFWALLLIALALLYRDIRELLLAVRCIESPRATRGERALSLFLRSRWELRSCLR